ncbi:hypothetical protein [Brevundimonas lenta]|uniref:YCII-related domain-containing protein n=1 Tax=Brevundimonas lenta TaxID=424796 RepID=A0A7W6NMU0_9CAUL|nr:hypothetical protein [Brevundimonas lenta]MBB4081705.1 hypothetical protein [Brevundimonas lenta]
MSTDGHYLAVFTSDKTGPQWQAWYALTEAEKAAKQAIGIPAVLAWDEAHRDVIVHQGGPLGFTKRISAAGEVTDVVNLLTVFMVVRAESHEAAVKLFEGHPHMTIFPCDGVEVMPVLGAD